jgi:hypothetical protein
MRSQAYVWQAAQNVQQARVSELLLLLIYYAAAAAAAAAVCAPLVRPTRHPWRLLSTGCRTSCLQRMRQQPVPPASWMPAGHSCSHVQHRSVALQLGLCDGCLLSTRWRNMAAVMLAWAVIGK